MWVIRRIHAGILDFSAVSSGNFSGTVGAGAIGSGRIGADVSCCTIRWRNKRCTTTESTWVEDFSFFEKMLAPRFVL